MTLREFLRVREVRQTDVADALGVSHWAVIKKLNGQRRWSVDEVRALAAFLAGRKVRVGLRELMVMCSSDATGEV
jgi:predicted transcriptional regulator